MGKPTSVFLIVYLYISPVNNYLFDVAAATLDIERMEEDGERIDFSHHAYGIRGI